MCNDGFSQVTGALLLVFNKTKLLDSVILSAVFFNIILLDILYNIQVGALINAIMYQTVFIIIIIQQREKMDALFKMILLNNQEYLTRGESILKSLISVVWAIILFFGYLYLSKFIPI